MLILKTACCRAPALHFTEQGASSRALPPQVRTVLRTTQTQTCDCQSEPRKKKRHLGKTSISYPYWGLLHCYDQVSDNNNLIEGMIHCGSLFLRCQPLMGRVAHSKAEDISGKGRSNHQHVAGALLPLPPFTWTTVWVLPQIWLILSEILS